ncbi:hypothetical protein [Morganella sp. EGD-HP17]|uniref:hypothetical protein n=1 Tax=Morganella sp. EGD-HP17 TaxID=1435146 RepID=UPI00044B87E0|nr:hypothetical protein [Morganella sp. EGD-HP17]ETO42513.1 hypothetical protein X965_02555 [Morganella sp. EGD-HP17]
MLSENKKNNAAANNNFYKIINWNIHVKLFRLYFKNICEQAKKDGFFEALYVSQDDNNRQIQLFSGQHPIRTHTKTHNTPSQKINIEHGAALVLSQSDLGDVAIILYPYTSENLTRIQPNIIWSIYSDPTKITDSVLKAATQDFFRYIRVSSAIFSESKLDQYRIQYLELKSKKYTENKSLAKFIYSDWLWKLLGGISSIITIYAIFK